MIWIIGAGQMAEEYSKVLTALKCKHLIIGRSKLPPQSYFSQSGQRVITGGLDNYLRSKPDMPMAAIIATPVETLSLITKQLINHGILKLLIEKPGGLDKQELSDLRTLATKKKAKVFIAYNRRFYSSIRQLREKIKNEGGATSCNFELTEWSHLIKEDHKDPQTMKRWFVANTSHVVDTVFFLMGPPETITCFSTGKISWHPESSRFSGAGKFTGDILFSYQGDWTAPGRWSIDISTKENRYYLAPMEKLHCQKLGSLDKENVLIDDGLDDAYKPGLYRQVESFINNCEDLCTLDYQEEIISIYEKMAGYH